MAQDVEYAFESKEARDFLRNLLKRSQDVSSKAFAAFLSPFVFADIIEHFQDQTGSKGKWKHWSKFYREHMVEIGKGGNKILQDTGRLRGSFKPTNFRIGSDSIVWYNNAKTASGFPYAAAHDQGGPKLPQRDFMYLSDKAQDKIETATLEFLEDF